MTMTDPIADMLTRLRNANVAHHETVKMPSSKLKEALAAILVREGYVAGFTVLSDDTRPGSFLEVTMKYSPDRSRTISGITARFQAGPTRLHWRRQIAPSPGWPGRGGAVHQSGADDRPRGTQAPRRRRSPLLCLVIGRRSDKCPW